MKRGYLNRDEVNQFMVIMATIQLINGERNLQGKQTAPMYEDWQQRGMMEKDEAKWVKTANTYLNKFITSKLKTLDKQEQIKLLKKIQKFDFRLVDDYTLQKLYRDFNDRAKYAVVENENFYKWTEEIMDVNCKGCTRDRCQCELYKVLEDNMIPESGWSLNNCEYAYTEIRKEVG